jgi:NADPH2:quinone reductase
VYANEADDPAIPTRRMMAANVTLHYVLLYGVPAKPLGAAVDWVAAAVDDGALTTLPLHRYALDQVAAAQDAVQQGAVGKVLVIP